MSARVRTSLLPPLSPSVQGRTEVRVIEPLPTCAAGLLHGWHVLLADDSPVQESAGSRQRLCEAAPQGDGNVWPAAPCCSWDDFNDAKVTCRCRMASVFIANRLKSSSLLHDERISGSCQRHLPIVMRRSATFVGHRKIKPRTARSKGSKPRGKKLNSNISKNETLRHLSDSCLRSTLHRQR